MSEREHQKDAIHAARQMTAELKELSERLDRVTAREEKTRRLTWRSIAAVAVDIALSVLVVVLYAQGQHNSATVSQLKAASVSACKASNQTRAQEIALWDHVISVAPPKTPAERRVDHEFIAYVRRVFTPKDCTAIYRAR